MADGGLSGQSTLSKLLYLNGHLAVWLLNWRYRPSSDVLRWNSDWRGIGHPLLGSY